MNAPNYIARDTYTGRHTVRKLKDDMFVTAMRAGDIAAESAEGVIWETFGTDSTGHEGFGRARYVADETGRLHVYASGGQKTITHPADRVLRVVRKRA